MKRSILALSLFLSCFSNYVSASVWDENNSWNSIWEKRFSTWLKSSEVDRNVFLNSSNTSSILRNTSTDCADALYALRIAFSYKHKLPFVMNAPSSYSSENGLLTNKATMFDHLRSEERKVRALIQYVSDMAGTLNLIKDTYPLEIREISAGDMYVTSWSFLGVSNRHAYFIKDRDRRGNLLLYYSDEPRRVRSLKVTKGIPDFVFDSKPWGYRRWRTPDVIRTPESKIPSYYPVSFEQYDLLAKYGKNRVLLAIRDLMAD